MEHERGAFKVNRAARFAKVKTASRKGLSLRTNPRTGSTAAAQKNLCRKFSQIVIIDHKLDSLPVSHTFFLLIIYADVISLSRADGKFFNKVIMLALLPRVAWFLRFR